MTISVTLLDDPDGLNMSGTQRIKVDCTPKPLTVEIYVDEKRVTSVTGATSYTYVLDTTNLSNATHIIRAEGVYKSRRSRTQVAVTVKNSSLSAGSYGAGAYGSGPYGGNS